MAHRILYLQYANSAAFPPLEHSSRILADEGWQVLLVNIGALGSADTLEFPPHPNIVNRRQPFCPAGWRQKLHYLWFGFRAFGWVIRWRPNWLYASDYLSAPFALALSYWPGLRVIYHEHDCPHPGSTTFIRFVWNSRTRLARRTAACVTPNQGRSQTLKDETGTTCPLFQVWNCPRGAEATQSEAVRTGKNGFVLFYHGTIVPARVPMSVLEALSRLPGNVRFQVAGYETVGHPDYVAQLKKEAARLGIAERFEYLGPISKRADLLNACRQADVGLALMPEEPGDINERTMAGASNKPFDYLACGLALLVSDLPDWREMFVTPGYAQVCRPSEADSIAKALQFYLEQPERRREMGQRGQARIRTEWNYEQQFQPVLSWMQSKGD